MSRKAPIVIESTNLTGHPGVRAWNELDGIEPASIELWRHANLTKPAIYRLTFASPRKPAVFAKRYVNTSPTLERWMYERVLPDLPLTTPRYYGSNHGDDGSHWLFIEDVGAERLSPGDPVQRVLAARWLALLHRSAADLPLAEQLPDAGPSRYLGHLRSARENIRRSAGNRGLTVEGHDILRRTLDQHDALESHWSELERACDGMPATLVHGDFRPKNVRVRADDAGPALYPIDWETAGWGVPAADLAPARGPGLIMLVDSPAYETVVSKRWPDLDATVIRRLSILGHLFRALAGIDWETISLTFESPDCLKKPLTCISHYGMRISEALGAAQGWLR